MIFTETPLKDAYIIELERIEDERGFFARSWCAREFEEHGLNPNLVQCNISFNKKKGTLRGMHYQAAPHEEAKLVRCTKGALYDVIIDLRSDSPTFKQWFGVELAAENHKALYIPEGFAHGFQTLEDDTEVFYQMAEFYHPEGARGVMWDDPAFRVEWPPNATRIVDEKDCNWQPHQQEEKQTHEALQDVSRELREHYEKKFQEFGATPLGVDWGKEEDVFLRYDRMLSVIGLDLARPKQPPRLLDVGCGYGGLLDYTQRLGFELDYSGVDMSRDMIDHAISKHPEARFHCGDILELDLPQRYDYVVCCGILTQKLSRSYEDMTTFAVALVQTMFSLCNRGVAFNIMTSKVNFQVDNLYYRNPADMLTSCLDYVTKRVIVDHSYPLYEYTVYLYRD